MPWKGIDHLIRAIRAVPDVRLLIAGEGPDAARLRALVESEQVTDRITFLGRVARERLGLYFRAADYTVLYSGYEGLSHTLLESLLAGTPVIASDKGGNPEVVRHNENGLLVPYIDQEALTETIRTAFSGDTTRAVGGANRRWSGALRVGDDGRDDASAYWRAYARPDDQPGRQLTR